MPDEVIQDCLPPLTLLFLRVFGFRIERYANGNTVCAGNELNGASTVTEGILDQLIGHDLGICSGEVKAKAAVFGFHPRRELAADTQIDAGTGRMPVVRRGVPLLDVIRCSVCPPDLGDRGFDKGFNCNFHSVIIS